MAKIIDDETMENVCILAKLSLSEEEKEKDKDNIRMLLKLFAEGYTFLR